MKKLSLDLRVSQILGVRFLSGLILWLIFMSLVGWGLLFLFELSPRSWQPVLGPCMHLAWPFIAAPMVLWSHDKIWRRSVTIRDIGSQIAIKVGHRERCHAWDDLRKVKAEIGSNKRGGYSDTRSLSLLLIFKGRTYRLATDEYVTELTKFQHYCQSKIRNRRKKAKKSK